MGPWLQIYGSLEGAYAALAERLNGSDGSFIFGTSPSSLDALLFGHLAFHQAAPVSCPEIQHHVSLHGQPGMKQFGALLRNLSFLHVPEFFTHLELHESLLLALMPCSRHGQHHWQTSKLLSSELPCS